jgi:hypothetical protein
MKKLHFLAWLLIVAVLSLTCPVLGEEAGIEITDALTPELPGDFEMDATGDDIEIVEPGEVVADIDIPLSDLALSDAPDLTLDATLDDALDSGVADEATEGGVAANGITPRQEVFRSVGGDDNDRLFAGYVDLLFGRKPKGDLRSNGFLGDRLTGTAKKVFDFLESKCKNVAAGSTSSTRFFLPASIGDYENFDEICDSLGSVLTALITDYPYQMFWFDKTQGFGAGYESDGVVYIFLAVSEEFASLNGEMEQGVYLTTDVSKIKSAQVAVTNAKKVVKKYAGVSDYKKLCGYRDYICDEVSYNYDAAADQNMPYGNPWQLIWAFDDNPATNIVCEGYSKAFQYLCDLSAFSGAVQCHIVTGSCGGDHMWNIVTMADGKNYHVDITNYDGGFEPFFMSGAGSQASDASWYTIADGIVYQFDKLTLGAYPVKTLKLSTRDFDPDNYNETVTTPTPTPSATPAPTPTAKVSMSKCKLTVKDQVYANKRLTPAVTVKYGSKTLKKGTDYTVNYDNNKAVGKATATVKGQGKYTGTKKITFKILPPAVKLSKLTAKKNSFTATWNKGTANTGYQLQYGLKKTFSGAKTVKVTNANTVMKTVKSLLKGKTYYVRVRAYKTVGKVNYYSAWSSVKSVTVK